MRICPYCGSPVEDDSQFCANCGSPTPPPQAAQRTVYCPNCGELIPAGIDVCPNCGVSLWPASAQGGQPPYGLQPYNQPPYDRQIHNQQPQDQKPAGKKRMGLIIGISAGAVALIALAAAAVLVISRLFSSPSRQFISYHEKLFVTRFLSGLEDGMDRAGSLSTDLIVTASTDNSLIDHYLADSALKLGIDMEDGGALIGGELILMGSSVFSGTATYDDGRFGFLLPQVDNTYYVMDMEKVIKNRTGEDVELDAEQSGLSGRHWRALMEAYLDIVYATITDKNVTLEKNRNVHLSGLGDSFTGKVYTFKPTAEDIEDMLLRLADRLEEDEDLRDAITLLMFSSDSLAVRVIPGLDGQDGPDKAILRFAEEMRYEARRLGHEVEQSGFTWTLAVEGDNVRQIRLCVDGDSRAFIYEAKGVESSGRSELIRVVSNGQTVAAAEHSCTVNGDQRSGSLTVAVGGGYDSFTAYEDSITLDYRYDSGRISPLGVPYGEYRLSASDRNLSFTMTVGDSAGGGVDHTIQIRVSGSYFGGFLEFGRLELNINAADRCTVRRPVQRPVDISDYSEQEFTEILDGIKSALTRELRGLVLGSLFGALFRW